MTLGNIGTSGKEDGNDYISILGLMFGGFDMGISLEQGACRGPKAVKG